VFGQIQFYDVPAPQLEVEVLIIELTELDQTVLGLDWDAWKTALSGSAAAASFSSRLESAGDAFNSSGRGLSGILSIDATAAARFLNYLVDKGKATIRARTTLAVTNQSLGTVVSGIGVPTYKYVYDPAIGKSVLTSIPPTGDVPGEGIALAMVPTIAMDAARLEVTVAMRSPVAIDKTGLPIFSQQEFTAELTLEQEQLQKIGGIRRGVQTIQRKGFPGLKDIPGIKYLFSSEARIIRESEVYIFLQPRWTSPRLPQLDGMRAGEAVPADLIAGILQQNPNLQISAEDAALLQRYFENTQQP
jgi:type II secretory pathway component GspD/PulD (secretin)